MRGGKKLAKGNLKLGLPGSGVLMACAKETLNRGESGVSQSSRHCRIGGKLKRGGFESMIGKKEILERAHNQGGHSVSLEK